MANIAVFGWLLAYDNSKVKITIIVSEVASTVRTLQENESLRYSKRHILVAIYEEKI